MVDRQPRPDGTILAFDVGGRRIGVAVGNTISGDARDVAVVRMTSDVPDWPAIDHLMRDWLPCALVVGDPRELQDETAMPPSRARARRFAQRLVARYPQAPLWLIDERRTSIEAARRFADGRAAGTRRRHQAERLDALAAAIILERWLRAPEQGEPWRPELAVP